MINYSQASENNKKPILAKLSQYLTPGSHVLEIGSGSGQHATFFSANLPDIAWQPSDTHPYYDGLIHNLARHGFDNIADPLHLNLLETEWQLPVYDCIYSANVIHIVSTELVIALMDKAAETVRPGGYLFIYGPFRYQSEFTTPSNAEFDQWLKDRDPASGIKDIEWINELASKRGFSLLADHPMPSNNQFLVYLNQS